jgi:hypothetical protein
VLVDDLRPAVNKNSASKVLVQDTMMEEWVFGG